MFNKLSKFIPCVGYSPGIINIIFGENNTGRSIIAKSLEQEKKAKEYLEKAKEEWLEQQNDDWTSLEDNQNDQ